MQGSVMGAIYDNLAYLDDCGDLEFGGGGGYCSFFVYFLHKIFGFESI
jgi:hypothetical protein